MMYPWLSGAAILDRMLVCTPLDYSLAQHLRAHTQVGFDVQASLRALRRNPRGATVHDEPSRDVSAPESWSFGLALDQMFLNSK